MTHSRTIHLVVLDEAEIRKAARFLAEMSKIDSKVDQDAWARMAGQALRACAIALHGADDPNVILLLANLGTQPGTNKARATSHK